jgi:hypothetical protein
MIMKKDLRYLQLASGDDLPALAGINAFKAILVIDTDSHQPWQWEVCRWLVASGARYVMAWGLECEAWHDAVDEAFLEATDYEDVSDEQMVVSTWHDDEDLADVFWFAKNRANYPALELNTTLILHIADAPRRDELEGAYKDA